MLAMRSYRFFLTKRVLNRHLVRQVDRRRSRELTLAVLTGLALAGAMLLYGYQHFEFIRIGYELEELRMEKESLLKVHRQLALERATLAAPERIESIAKRRLEMAPPVSGQVLLLSTVEKR